MSILLARLARRGGRCPVWAHAVAVSASLRLRCDARSTVAPQNSLRELKLAPLRQLRRVRSRSARVRAPTVLLRFSPPQKSPPPGTAHRAATLVVFDDPHTVVLPAKAWAGGRRSAYAQPRSAGLAGRAPSALQALTRGICSNAANAVSVVSYAAGLQDRASQGTLAQRGQASKRSRLPARAFARSLVRRSGGCQSV